MTDINPIDDKLNQLHAEMARCADEARSVFVKYDPNISTLIKELDGMVHDFDDHQRHRWAALKSTHQFTYLDNYLAMGRLDRHVAEGRDDRGVGSEENK